MRSTVFAAAVLACLIAPPLAAQSIHVVKAASLPGDGKDNAPPQDTFKRDTPQITVMAQLDNVKPGDKVTGKWIAEKTSAAPPNYEIDGSTLAVDKPQIVAFHLTKPTAGWPIGDYRVEISFNGGAPEYSQRFKVVE